VLENNSLRANGSTWTVGGYNTLNDAHGSTTHHVRLMGSLGILAWAGRGHPRRQPRNQSTSSQTLAISTGTPSYYSVSVHEPAAPARRSRSPRRRRVREPRRRIDVAGAVRLRLPRRVHRRPGPAALGSLQDFIIGVQGHEWTVGPESGRDDQGWLKRLRELVDDHPKRRSSSFP